jgi:hypothetical protein
MSDDSGFSPHQQTDGRVIGGQTHPRTNRSEGSSDQKNVTYPSCVQCEQRHPSDYSVPLG